MSRRKVLQRLAREVRTDTLQIHVIELLGAATGEDLDRVPRQLGGPRTVAEWIIDGLHDKAKHCGETYLPWKMCRTRDG